MTQTNIDQLLQASLLCGLKPEGKPAHRLQLIFVVNKDLRSRSHQMDLQRALETGVDRYEFWQNHDKGGGEYCLTLKGFEKAKVLFPDSNQKYSPASGETCNYSIQGELRSGKSLLLRTRFAKTEIFLNNHKVSAKEVCRQLGINARGNAVVDLYNLAIDLNFEMKWNA
jgi:hypothetical protein